MTKLSHVRAQQLMDLDLDIGLGETDLADLQAHLRECADCRAYGEQLDSMESSLRRVLSVPSTARPRSVARPGFPLIPGTRVPDPDGRAARLTQILKAHPLRKNNGRQFRLPNLLSAASLVIALVFILAWFIPASNVSQSLGRLRRYFSALPWGATATPSGPAPAGYEAVIWPADASIPLDRVTPFEFGASVRYQSDLRTQVQVAAFGVSPGETVPDCKEQEISQFKQFGAGQQIFEPGQHEFNRRFTYADQPGVDRLVIRLSVLNADNVSQVLFCNQRVYELSPNH